MNIINTTIELDKKFYLKQRNGILQKFALVLFIAIAFAIGFVFLVKRADADSCDFEIPACVFEEQEGRKIINFGDKKIVSHLSQEDAKSGPISINLPAGSYKVSLFSYDGYAGRESVSPQPIESWLALFRKSDSIIAQSASIDDLEDGVSSATKTQAVNEDLAIDEDVDSVMAQSASYPDESSSNGVFPVCAAFDLIKLKEESPINNAPVITLLGDNPMTLNVGDSFTDPGATASDTEDGDLTGSIVVGGDAVDTGTASTYTITYNVSDSEGKTADEVTRNAVVSESSGGGGSSSSASSEDSSSSSSSSDGGDTGGVGGDNDGSVSVGEGSGRISFGGSRITLPSMSSPLSGALTATSTESSLSSSVGQCSYLNDYLKLGEDNNPAEVLKLQGFLITMEHYSIPLTGAFDQATFDAVSDFQKRYKEDILAPWGYEVPTGYVYITTKNKINEIFCGKEIPFSEEQKTKIEKVRAYIEEFGSTDGADGSGSEGIGGDIGSAVGEIGGGANGIDKSDYLAAGVGFIKSPMSFILDNKLTVALIGIAITLLVYMFSFRGGKV
ncbi:MAG: hypothetical protein HW401_185 [Parcubacteria group bacterium]|nr:hypothetical protein [Parcubacteria group bacterium]